MEKLIRVVTTMPSHLALSALCSGVAMVVLEGEAQALSKRDAAVGKSLCPR